LQIPDTGDFDGVIVVEIWLEIVDVKGSDGDVAALSRDIECPAEVGTFAKARRAVSMGTVEFGFYDR
jgi:hypothetical protein